MTLEEIKKLWPAWRIELVCDYACEKLRNLLHVKYVFLESGEWEYWLDPEDEDYQIKLKFENQVDGSYLELEFVDDLFTKNSLETFDEKIGANKMQAIRDKVVLRLAWHLRDRWKGKYD